MSPTLQLLGSCGHSKERPPLPASCQGDGRHSDVVEGCVGVGYLSFNLNCIELFAPS